MDTDVGIPVHYVIENTSEAGLGRSLLWGGKVRIFQDDGHGATIFLGEDSVGLTPVGEEMRIYIGDSRDVSVTQVKTRNNRINPRPDRKKVVLYDTDEEIHAEVENFKDTPVTVDLVEHIPGEWEMLNTSAVFEKKDANTIVYSVKIPAKGKERITFH